MIDPVLLTISGIVIFLAVPIFQFTINPASLSQYPTAEDSMSVVAQTAAQSIAIFAIVLVIIQFILDNGAIDGYRLLAINVLVLSTSFLMVTFIMELIADIKVLFFHLQLTALRYSGLLLFLGLYFLLLSTDTPDIIPAVFGAFVSITWLAWFIHEAHYLFVKQSQEWEGEDMTKVEYLCEYKTKVLEKLPPVD